MQIAGPMCRRDILTVVAIDLALVVRKTGTCKNNWVTKIQ